MPRPFFSRLFSLQAAVFFVVGMAVAFSLSWGLRFFPSAEHFILGAVSNVTPETVLAATNQQRRERRLPELRASEALSQAASQKAQDMINGQYWSHTAPGGEQAWDFIHDAGYTYRIAGENLARDFVRVDELTTAWLNSPTHRENVLNVQYEEMGIAVAHGMFGEKETTIVVALFAQPALVGEVSNSMSQLSGGVVLPDTDLRWLELLFIGGIAGSIGALAFARVLEKR